MSKSKEDLVRGCLYGFVIGDAMGATTEFETKQSIVERYGVVDEIIGGGWLSLRPGEVTDDTQMSICVMDAIMEAKGSYSSFASALARNFITWKQTKPKDIGNQCSYGIEKLCEGKMPPRQPNALGNGSLMRAMPCALLGCFAENVLQGRMTHYNETCDAAILQYSEILYNLIAFEDYSAKQISTLLQPTGCVINTLNNALWYLQESLTFKEGMLNAVNDGGDADTIAAITGSLLGAKFGYNQIPKNWIDRLDVKVRNKLEEFILYTLSFYSQRGIL